MRARALARLSPLRGGVDRNAPTPAAVFGIRMSPLRGGVDRNIQALAIQLPDLGRPFAGAWIETVAAI